MSEDLNKGANVTGKKLKAKSLPLKQDNQFGREITTLKSTPCRYRLKHL